MSITPNQQEQTSSRLRIDVWLWRARFFKTRSEAGRFAAEGRIRVNRGGTIRKLEKAAALISVGDVLVFARGEVVTSVEVVSCGWRRGPAPEARALYADRSSEIA